MPRTDNVEVVLRRIARRVLDDVWISPRVRVFALITAALLAGAAATGWLTDVHSIWMSRVATVMFALTSALSSMALWRHSFRWCCAAAGVGAVSTVAGLGVVWWHQTAPETLSAGPSAWMVIGMVCATALTATWLRLTLTPLGQSQPDIRRISVQEAV
ncbi:hypothetical protein [Mycobacterium pinniadriaticum]|uniref:Transmembrane protein n=1 Tax=Mycobacterium pinniadriaticum TaxID=2994102 RepID=A0ABT3SCW0_9MYCO|nr:hypothetical protein [Mycobacterium pinniadriaticum]MCX2936984.1 hypothetical protein [Mycobacterium pinniadriaticum]